MFELSAGQIVADKYRIDGVMGTGGMGVVVAATHVELDQKVAIKFLREVSPEALARFQREARLLVRLKSPHVARVFDVGSLDDDTPYIVMEHLDGSDLASIAASRGKLPVGETVDYIVQASEAVAEAHAMGMVHRDLKPANLFLAKGPGGTTSVKVLDFGVSKILDDRAGGASSSPRGGDLTNEGVALGSPGYMSPEQMTSSRDVDERSDIFSLGALLYRLVAGQAPYKGNSVVSILAQMATEPLPPLRSFAPDAPERFTAIVERCLAHDKAARFPTVAHLAHALFPFATRRGRVSIEQILATLNVTFPDDGLGETLVRPVHAPAPSSRPAGVSGEGGTMAMPRESLHHDSARVIGPMGVQGLGPAMQTGPQFTVSAPASMPPSFLHMAPLAAPATSRASHAPIFAIGLAVVTLVAALVTWRVFRPRADHDGEAGASSSSLMPTVMPPASTTPTPTVTAPPSVVSPSVDAAPPPPEPTIKPKPAGGRRPTGTGTPKGAGGGASPPPNPADVPGGRR